MHRAALLACLVVGCATGDDDGVRPRPDAGADAGARDTGSPGDVAPEAIFPVEDAGEKGLCGTPAGTTITASGSYSSTPEMAIDGNLDTYWNSGGYTGSVRLKFAGAIRFDRVRLAATALPACDETYTLVGWVGGAPTTIATATRSVPSVGAWLPTIEVTAGTWDELSVEVAKAASWITLGEIVVFDSTAGCGLP
ncbi:MAG: hypothetical protein HYV09_15030 [Deltaproteobacteria bacterium]|nr:hypothetical protein [Deltaproteobacteria bacterium]